MLGIQIHKLRRNVPKEYGVCILRLNIVNKPMFSALIVVVLCGEANWKSHSPAGHCVYVCVLIVAASELKLLIVCAHFV